MQEYNGRVLGDIANMVGIEPVTDTLQSFPIGKETREYAIKIAAACSGICSDST